MVIVPLCILSLEKNIVAIKGLDRFFTLKTSVVAFHYFMDQVYLLLQVLLKPIVSQLVVEPPTSLEEHPSITAVNEVDDLLVSCIGQMAVTAGSDLLWKSLNHEVIFLILL